MLLFAIEQSGSGPPKGYMNLDENDAGGTAAFLRSMQNFINPIWVPNYQETIFSDDKVPTIIPPMNEMKSDWVKSYQGNNIDGTFNFSRAVVSPLVLFLHVDQGSFAKVGYTPFASPVANIRSVYQNHVDDVSTEVMGSEGLISQEDFAIVGYQILLTGEERPERDGLKPMKYRCILNRDKNSVHTVVSKEFVLVTKDNLEHIYVEVSEMLMMICFVDYHSNLHFPFWCYAYCFLSEAVWN